MMDIVIRYLKVLFISAVPVLELRGAIPYGVTTQNLPLLNVLIASIIGNMIPVPIIILFVRPVFEWMRKKSAWMRRIVEKMEAKAANKSEMIRKYEMLGLFILVAVPLPGTGAWTGSLVAAMLDMRLKYAVPVIFLGVVTAGIITSIITFGAGMLIGG